MLRGPATPLRPCLPPRIDLTGPAMGATTSTYPNRSTFAAAVSVRETRLVLLGDVGTVFVELGAGRYAGEDVGVRYRCGGVKHGWDSLFELSVFFFPSYEGVDDGRRDSMSRSRMAAEARLRVQG